MEFSNLAKAFENLQVKDDYNSTLDQIISFIQDLGGDVKQNLPDDLNINQALPVLLELLSEESDCQVKVTHVIAELAKSDCYRETLVEQGFVPPLISGLKQNTVELATQTCRALGNICFDNDAGRVAVEEEDGLTRLIKLMGSIKTGDDEDTMRLRVICTGFFLNLSNSNSSIQLKSINLGASRILCDYLHHHPTDRDLCHMILATLSSLFDQGAPEENVEEVLQATSSLLELLSSPLGDTYLPDGLELLLLLTECEEVKELVAGSDMPRNLLNIITEKRVAEKSHDDEAGIELDVMAADIIVSLLRGDKSMHILYGDGQGIVYNESVKWLSSGSEHLETSGSLAVGNFARSDNHCLQLVKANIVPLLLSLLDRGHPPNITLQHACLSALRNLAIPVVNKPVLVASGVLKSVLNMSDTEVLPVIFKLIGVIRMLIDGQKDAAMFVASNSAFMTRLVDWCTVEEHVGVKGESTRLLAWIVKNASTPTVHAQIVNADAICHLVSMILSEHHLMQLEGLLALWLLSSTSLDLCASQLKQADIVTVLCSLLKQDSAAPEVLANALALISNLIRHKSIREELLEVGIADLIDKLKSHDDQTVSESATELCNRLSLPTS